MNDISSDDIFLLKQRLAEQEALIHALQEKLSNREREIDHLQAQLDKLRRMNFGSRSEKVSRRIAQMEADLNRLQKESDTLTGRVYDPAVQRPLRQTRTRKPFPESLPRDEKRLLPAAPCCPNCGGSLSYLGEDTRPDIGHITAPHLIWLGHGELPFKVVRDSNMFMTTTFIPVSRLLTADQPQLFHEPASKPASHLVASPGCHCGDASCSGRTVADAM